jgi:FMN phosphatase YigB (HAD superfamily)
MTRSLPPLPNGAPHPRSPIRPRKTDYIITQPSQATTILFDHTHSIRKQITYAEADSVKIRLFFASLKLPFPSEEEMQEFRARYQKAYYVSRRASPGAIETLVRLKKWWYRLTIVTNWQIVDPREKPEAICVAELLNVLLRAKKLVLRNLIEEFLNLR